MSFIPVQIPTSLKIYCGQRAELNVIGNSIEEVLSFLSEEHPDLYQSICDETGSVRQPINFFVNSQWIPVHEASGRNAKIEIGDVLTIWTAVSGG
jgi:hypothetical protein